MSITVHTKGGTLFLKAAHISCCQELDSQSTIISLNGGKLKIYDSMAELERQLLQEGFLRVSPSSLINPDCIKRYIDGADGKPGELVLSNDIRVKVTPDYRAQIFALQKPG